MLALRSSISLHVLPLKARKQPTDTVVMVGGGNFNCSYTYGGICALREDSIFGLTVGGRRGFTSCVIPRSFSKLNIYA